VLNSVNISNSPNHEKVSENYRNYCRCSAGVDHCPSLCFSGKDHEDSQGTD
jgi:hypothetical protein